MSDLSMLGPAEEIWGLKAYPIAKSVAAMFRMGKLHSMAIVATQVEHHVLIPFVTWVNLRQLSDRAKVPSSVYIEAPMESQVELFYASWPLHTGLDYTIVPDPVNGACVKIPIMEFKPVAKKAATA